MSPLTHRDAALLLRDAVTALSSRLGSDFGDLVPDASAERTAALVSSLESGAAGGISDEGIRTLDSWIRLADSAMLHDDAAEAQVRADIAQGLHAVRALVVPRGEPLTTDPRET